MALRRFLAILALLAVSGCSTPAPIDVAIACPPLRTWSPAEQAALAIALGSVPKQSVLWELELDWQSLRDSVRACNNSPKH